MQAGLRGAAPGLATRGTANAGAGPARRQGA